MSQEISWQSLLLYLDMGEEKNWTDWTCRTRET